MNLKDLVAFLYGGSMQCDVQNEHQVLLGDVDLLHLSDEMDGAGKTMSRSTFTAEMTGVKDKNIASHLSPNYLVDAPSEENSNSLSSYAAFLYFVLH